MKRKTADAARGKWRGILMALGLEQKYLTGKHGPCPMCGGNDRFRWDNKDGNGTFFCSQCGAGNGFELLMQMKGYQFADAAADVDRIVGNVEPEPVRQRIDPERLRQLKNDLWAGSRPMALGDMAHAYLAGRVPLPDNLPTVLRFTKSCPSPDGVHRPALLAMVHGADGHPVNIHRTFLGPNGKADMQDPRAMMPGAVPDGSAIRLFPVHGERLGIAEGIETAFAAAARFNVPVWSAVNATMLAKWTPPPTVREVLVFGDNDPKFGGQAAAYGLAHKLAAGKLRLSVEVHIPRTVGADWADKVA